MFIGEASKLSGATQRAIRLYESMGLLKISREGKYRTYTHKKSTGPPNIINARAQPLTE